MAKPRISYSHALSEIAVNRSDPCELVRELVSNSYDAHASTIHIFPLLNPETLIFFDDGIGLSDSETTGRHDVTPFESFFSIGTSTKTKDAGQIGYKCQGSKLCFASSQVTVITRCQNEERWRIATIDNPRENLNPDKNIPQETANNPWDRLSSILAVGHATAETSRAISFFNKDFFCKHFLKGTLIIIKTPEIEEFGKYFDQSREYPYLVEYIRFFTAHGNVNYIDDPKKGFPPAELDAFRKRSKTKCRLNIWTGEKLSEVPFGFPYLESNHNKESHGPLEVGRLNDGRFHSRRARVVQFEGRSYALILAIDGYRKALQDYKSLSRQGKELSGVKLSQQRGVLIASNGVRVLQHNELFSDLENYSSLAERAAASHYQFIIDGAFDLVTNRNSLTATSKELLKKPEFIRLVRNFLDDVKNNDSIFRDLIARLNNERLGTDLNKQASQIEELRKEVKEGRERFKVKRTFGDRVFIAPVVGEENLVGALYFLFSNLVPEDSPFREYWKRPLTMSSRGIDSLVVDNELKPLDVNNKMLEYKTFFNVADEFNHPLKFTHTIVCWEIRGDFDNKQLEDQWGFYGTARRFNDIGAMLGNIGNDSGEFIERQIPILSLKQLLTKTFDVTWLPPPPKATPIGKQKEKKTRSMAKV